jgi:type I restriction enzyme, S subunit
MSESFFLNSLLKFTRDGEWGKGEPSEDAIEMRIIRGTDFDEVRVGQLGNVPIRYVARRYAEYKALEPNDILLETAGGSKDRPTGRTLFVKPSLIYDSDLPLTCASFARFLRVDPQKADPHYLFWHLQYLYEAGHMRQYHTQHTGVARFQYTTFAENEPLQLPPLSTQRKIAAILSAYDDLIENNSRRIAILEEMAQTLYREWFVHFRYPGHEGVPLVESPLGPVPEGWEVVRLGDVCKIGRGSSPRPIIDQRYFEGGTIPWIKIADATKSGRYLYETKQRVNEYGASFSRLLPRGSLIVAASGTLGYTQLLGVEGCVHDGWLYLEDFIGIDKLYLYELLHNKQQFFQNSAYGAAIQNINTTILREMEIVLPPSDIQQQFEHFISSVDLSIDNIGRKNANLRQTRDLLLPRLISGEVEVAGVEIAGSEI